MALLSHLFFKFLSMLIGPDKQASYVDAVVFPDQHYESGLSDISNVESLVWKARADALIHLQIPNSLMS
ncbi:Uncharacterised protein [Vibrio cholerae]|nr:Uncharacterised protein [Vibrio cholerae]